MTNIENENIKLLAAQIQKQGEIINKQGESIEKQSESVARIEDALLGTKFNKEGGFIPRLIAVEKKVAGSAQSISRYEWKWQGAVWVIGGIAGVLAIAYYVTQIFHSLK